MHRGVRFTPPKAIAGAPPTPSGGPKAGGGRRRRSSPPSRDAGAQAPAKVNGGVPALLLRPKPQRRCPAVTAEGRLPFTGAPEGAPAAVPTMPFQSDGDGRTQVFRPPRLRFPSMRGSRRWGAPPPPGAEAPNGGKGARRGLAVSRYCPAPEVGSSADLHRSGAPPSRSAPLPPPEGGGEAQSVRRAKTGVPPGDQSAEETTRG